MTVNSGIVKVTLDHAKIDMRSLVKESLALTNDSPYIVEKKANDILLSNGRNRLMEGVYSHDSDYEYNPYDDNDVINEGYVKLHNIQTDEDVVKIAKAISYMTVTQYKKALIMSFIKSGQHINYGDSFKLDESIVQNDDEYDELTRIKMEEDNKFINEKIKACIDFYYERSEELWNWFYETVIPMSNYPEEFRMAIDQRATIITDVNQNQWKKPDVDRMFINLRAGNIDELNNNDESSEQLTESGDIDEDSIGSDYLIRREEVQNFRLALNNFREGLESARNISFNDSAKIFDISVSNARKHRPEAYKMFLDISGLSEDVLPDYID